MTPQEAYMLLTVGIFKCAMISVFGLGLLHAGDKRSEGISSLTGGVLLIGAILMGSPYSPLYTGGNEIAGLFTAFMSVIAIVTIVVGCYVLPVLNKRRRLSLPA